MHSSNELNNPIIEDGSNHIDSSHFIAVLSQLELTTGTFLSVMGILLKQKGIEIASFPPVLISFFQKDPLRIYNFLIAPLLSNPQQLQFFIEIFKRDDISASAEKMEIFYRFISWVGLNQFYAVFMDPKFNSFGYVVNESFVEKLEEIYLSSRHLRQILKDVSFVQQIQRVVSHEISCSQFAKIWDEERYPARERLLLDYGIMPLCVDQYPQTLRPFFTKHAAEFSVLYSKASETIFTEYRYSQTLPLFFEFLFQLFNHPRAQEEAVKEQLLSYLRVIGFDELDSLRFSGAACKLGYVEYDDNFFDQLPGFLQNVTDYTSIPIMRFVKREVPFSKICAASSNTRQMLHLFAIMNFDDYESFNTLEAQNLGYTLEDFSQNTNALTNYGLLRKNALTFNQMIKWGISYSVFSNLTGDQIFHRLTPWYEAFENQSAMEASKAEALGYTRESFNQFIEETLSRFELPEQLFAFLERKISFLVLLRMTPSLIELLIPLNSDQIQCIFSFEEWGRFSNYSLEKNCGEDEVRLLLCEDGNSLYDLPMTRLYNERVFRRCLPSFEKHPALLLNVINSGYFNGNPNHLQAYMARMNADIEIASTCRPAEQDFYRKEFLDFNETAGARKSIDFLTACTFKLDTLATSNPSVRRLLYNYAFDIHLHFSALLHLYRMDPGLFLEETENFYEALILKYASEPSEEGGCSKLECILRYPLMLHHYLQEAYVQDPNTPKMITPKMIMKKAFDAVLSAIQTHLPQQEENRFSFYRSAFGSRKSCRSSNDISRLRKRFDLFLQQQSDDPSSFHFIKEFSAVYKRYSNDYLNSKDPFVHRETLVEFNRCASEILQQMHFIPLGTYLHFDLCGVTELNKMLCYLMVVKKFMRDILNKSGNSRIGSLPMEILVQMIPYLYRSDPRNPLEAIATTQLSNFSTFSTFKTRSETGAKLIKNPQENNTSHALHG